MFNWFNFRLFLSLHFTNNSFLIDKFVTDQGLIWDWMYSVYRSSWHWRQSIRVIKPSPSVHVAYFVITIPWELNMFHFFLPETISSWRVSGWAEVPFSNSFISLAKIQPIMTIPTRVHDYQNNNNRLNSLHWSSVFFLCVIQ